MDRVVRLKIIFFGHHINIISPLKNKIMKGKKKKKKRTKTLSLQTITRHNFFLLRIVYLHASDYQMSVGLHGGQKD